MLMGQPASKRLRRFSASDMADYKLAFGNGGHSGQTDTQILFWDFIVHLGRQDLECRFHHGDRDPFTRTAMVVVVIAASLGNKSKYIRVIALTPLGDKGITIS